MENTWLYLGSRQGASRVQIPSVCYYGEMAERVNAETSYAGHRHSVAGFDSLLSPMPLKEVTWHVAELTIEGQPSVIVSTRLNIPDSPERRALA